MLASAPAPAPGFGGAAMAVCPALVPCADLLWDVLSGQQFFDG